jgi:hypothetical protein
LCVRRSRYLQNCLALLKSALRPKLLHKSSSASLIDCGRERRQGEVAALVESIHGCCRNSGRDGIMRYEMTRSIDGRSLSLWIRPIRPGTTRAQRCEPNRHRRVSPISKRRSRADSRALARRSRQRVLPEAVWTSGGPFGRKERSPKVRSGESHIELEIIFQGTRNLALARFRR